MFKHIDEEEYKQLTKAIAQITVLIAGADDNIDEDEIAWAKKLTKIRSFSYVEELKAYYMDVGQTFEDDLNKLIKNTDQNQNERTTLMTGHLTALNSILPKLENYIGATLYDSFLSFAEHVAKASGGFMRFASVSQEEKALIDLPMIDPINIIIEDGDEPFDEVELS